jgi:hypothetical protein
MVRQRLNHLTHSIDGFSLPDADPESVIVGRCMDWQRNMGRKPSFHRLGLGTLKAFGVVNSVDDCHKHRLTVRSFGGGALLVPGSVYLITPSPPTGGSARG